MHHIQRSHDFQCVPIIWQKIYTRYDIILEYFPYYCIMQIALIAHDFLTRHAHQIANSFAKVSHPCSYLSLWQLSLKKKIGNFVQFGTWLDFNYVDSILYKFESISRHMTINRLLYYRSVAWKMQLHKFTHQIFFFRLINHFAQMLWSDASSGPDVTF